VLIPFLECHFVEGLSQLLKLPQVQYAFQRKACECIMMNLSLPDHNPGSENNFHFFSFCCGQQLTQKLEITLEA
jgi:hypothetical protein